MIEAMNLTILTPDDAPAASQPILDGIAADLGFVPNLAAVPAASPTLLAAFDALRRTVADPTFDPIHREIAGVAVGVAVDNAYGVAFHSTMLGKLGVDEPDIDAMRAGADRTTPSMPPSTPSHVSHAASREGRRRRRPTCPRRRTHRCRLLQIVAECVFAGLVGTIDNLAGRVPLDEFLRPRQWKAG